MPLLDDWLPEFDVVERHDAAVPLPPERALEVALASPAAPDRIVAALLRARGLPARGRTIEELFGGDEFRQLGRRPTEWAAALERPGAEIAIDFRAEPIPGGSRLSTETRVRGDERAGPPPLPPLLARDRPVLGVDPPPLARGSDRVGEALRGASGVAEEERRLGELDLEHDRPGEQVDARVQELRAIERQRRERLLCERRARPRRAPPR